MSLFCASHQDEDQTIVNGLQLYEVKASIENREPNCYLIRRTGQDAGSISLLISPTV